MEHVNTYINKHLALIIVVPAIALSLLLAGTTHAQDASTTNSVTSSTTLPGSPSTGSGGYAAVNSMILALSALAAAGGMVYLYRSQSESGHA